MYIVFCVCLYVAAKKRCYVAINGAEHIKLTYGKMAPHLTFYCKSVVPLSNDENFTLNFWSFRGCPEIFNPVDVESSSRPHQIFELDPAWTIQHDSGLFKSDCDTNTHGQRSERLFSRWQLPQICYFFRGRQLDHGLQWGRAHFQSGTEGGQVLLQYLSRCKNETFTEKNSLLMKNFCFRALNQIQSGCFAYLNFGTSHGTLTE